MGEVVREILPVVEHMEDPKPLFVWTAKECELIHKYDDVAKWGKPLAKVWKAWPCWNATNTIIVDHHAPRVECNPQANVIVPPSFYVGKIVDLSEDNDYLKVKLWPALGGLNTHKDVASFRCALNVSGKHARVCAVNTNRGALCRLSHALQLLTQECPNLEVRGLVDFKFTVDIVPSPVILWNE